MDSLTQVRREYAPRQQATPHPYQVTHVSGPDREYGGGGGIRTPETLTGLTVFKTAGFNRSPTPPH